MGLRSAGSTLGVRSLIPFGYDDTNVPANANNVAMSGLGASTEGDYVPFPFSIIAIAVRGNADCTAGSVSFEAMLDGAATGLIATINTTNPRQVAVSQAPGINSVASAGRVHCRYSSTAGFLPVTTEYEVFVYVVADISNVH